jgi:hypothetical protein
VAAAEVEPVADDAADSELVDDAAAELGPARVDGEVVADDQVVRVEHVEARALVGRGTNLVDTGRKVPARGDAAGLAVLHRDQRRVLAGGHAVQ